MPDEDESVDEIERELEQRLRDLRLHGDDHPQAERFPPPPSDEEVDLKLQSMQDKVASAGKRTMPDPPDLKFQRPASLRPQPEDRHGYKGLGVGMTAAYALVGMMAMGFGIGWLLDHGKDSMNFGPAIGGLIGCVAGIGFVIWLVNRDK